MYRDEQKVILVCTCHEQSRRTTDKYLTVAIPVIVNKEFMPITLKMMYDIFCEWYEPKFSEYSSVSYITEK